MKTPGQRGPFGSWLQAERLRRYDSQKDALDAMRRLAGLHINESEYAQWESGSRVPREDNPKVARLYEFFGSRPESTPEEQPESSDILVQLLAEQAETNRLLAARLDALEALVATLTAPTLADPQALEAMRSWGRDALDRSRTRVQRPDQLRVTE